MKFPDCPECDGTGRIHSHNDTCWTCVKRRENLYKTCARCGHQGGAHVYRDPIATEPNTYCEQCSDERSPLGPFCAFRAVES